MTRLGLIGAGNFGQRHMANARKVDGVQIAAVCDVNAQQAERVGASVGAAVYTDYVRMLEGEKLDAILICVPPFVRGEMELKAIEMGLPFFVEKPLDVGIEKAERVAAALERKPVITAVGFHLRQSDAVKQAREIIGDRTIGMVLGKYMVGFPPVPWFRKRELSGGQLVEQTIHFFDLARHLVGEVTEVYAQSALRIMTDVEGIDVPDVGTVTLKFASGAIGNISNSCVFSPADMGLHIYVRGQVIEIGETATALGNGTLRVHGRDKTTEYRYVTNGHAREMEVFIQAVRTGDPSGILSPYADALKTQRLLHAANLSAASGEPVKLG